MANWRGCQSLLTMASSGELTYVIACLLPLSLRDFATLPQDFCKDQHQNTNLINCRPTVTGLASEATCMVVDRIGDRGYFHTQILGRRLSALSSEPWPQRKPQSPLYITSTQLAFGRNSVCSL